VRRTKLLQFLESDEAGWKNEDHPELSGGAGRWVRQLRRESDRAVSAPKKSQRPRA
jgi:hypothetical protein